MAHFNPKACISSCCPCDVFFRGCVLFWTCATNPIAVRVVQFVDEEETKEWIIATGNSLVLEGEPEGAVYHVIFQHNFGQQFIKVAELSKDFFVGCPDFVDVPPTLTKTATLSGISPINLLPPNPGDVREYWGCLAEINGTYVVPRSQGGCGLPWDRPVFNATFDATSNPEKFPILKNLCYTGGPTPNLEYIIPSACITFGYTGHSSCVYRLFFRAVIDLSFTFGVQPIYAMLVQKTPYPDPLFGVSIPVPCVEESVTIEDVAFFDFEINQRVSTYGKITIETVDTA